MILLYGNLAITGGELYMELFSALFSERVANYHFFLSTQLFLYLYSFFLADVSLSYDQQLGLTIMC